MRVFYPPAKKKGTSRWCQPTDRNRERSPPPSQGSVDPKGLRPRHPQTQRRTKTLGTPFSKDETPLPPPAPPAAAQSPRSSAPPPRPPSPQPARSPCPAALTVHIPALSECGAHSPGAASRGAQLGAQLREHGARAHAPRRAQGGRVAGGERAPPPRPGRPPPAPAPARSPRPGVCAARHLPLSRAPGALRKLGGVSAARGLRCKRRCPPGRGAACAPARLRLRGRDCAPAGSERLQVRVREAGVSTPSSPGVQGRRGCLTCSWDLLPPGAQVKGQTNHFPPFSYLNLLL